MKETKAKLCFLKVGMGFKTKPIPCVKITLFPASASLKPVWWVYSHCVLSLFLLQILEHCFFCFFFFYEVAVSTDGFPFQLFVGHPPRKCIYEESQGCSQINSLCILYLDDQRVLLASISEEISTLRDLARLMKQRTKFSVAIKCFSSECSWTQNRILLREPTEPIPQWWKAVLKEPNPEKSCDRHVTASVIKNGAWKAVLESGCGLCLESLSWKK